MCSHYQALNDLSTSLRCFEVAPENIAANIDIWSGNIGSFIRRRLNDQNDCHSNSRCEIVPGIFGLIPDWTQDIGISKHTFNAPSETAFQSPSYKNAWSQARHCIIAASAIFEPDCKGPKAVPTRIVLSDGEPMGIAGLWSACKLPHKTIYSYALLTINADKHGFMSQFGKRMTEKRMVVVLPKNRYLDWLNATPEESMAFMQAYPAQNFQIATNTTVKKNDA
jgi:putative SOS response-associated peptidase YedK